VRSHQSFECWLRSELREPRQAYFFFGTDERRMTGCFEQSFGSNQCRFTGPHVDLLHQGSCRAPSSQALGVPARESRAYAS
jgi:hypothetical protein